jgi:pimeloyl-ACP methyl ester carboxylesterase
LTKSAGRGASILKDARGGVRLAIDGVRGVTGIVEAMHQRIAGGAPPLGRVPDKPTRGITGLVYRSIHGTTALVGKALDTALAGAQAVVLRSTQDLPDAQAQPVRDAVVAALNGIVGDHLASTGNPLAIEMELRFRSPDLAPASPHLLLLVHGLCMNDAQWLRGGHDHGESLARAFGYSPVYARYNTGLHISENGAELARKLEELIRTWPVQVKSATIIGHSMGGLVARSALHQATLAGMQWPHHLKQLIFLGTPHHGAPLERGGNWLHRALGISPYVAPFARLSGLRSAGITDLRHGSLTDADWQGDRFASRDTRTMIPLPAGIACYAIAGTLGRDKADHLLGDGLVPLESALGHHARPTRELHIPSSHQFVARGVNHLDLLSSDAVYQRLKRWLTEVKP